MHCDGLTHRSRRRTGAVPSESLPFPAAVDPLSMLYIYFILDEIMFNNMRELTHVNN